MSAGCDFPLPSSLEKIISSCYLNVPVVFKKCNNSWRTVPWTVSKLKEQLGECELKFQLVSKSEKEITWEGQRECIEATISQFLSWQAEDSEKLEGTNPFKKYAKEGYWSYSGYNYMNLVIPDVNDILQLDWGKFGFPGKTGNDSTLWLGSKGAYTPCHSDSYGCNLVAQILGRKKWILFPPSDLSCMYPTRFPYEESSIFSRVNLLNPDTSAHPLFKNSHPHVVILEPGDVLFVPNKWWHFVLNLDNVTLSINTWLELNSDCHSRLEEGVARTMMSSLLSFYGMEKPEWINPNEEITSPEVNLSYIKNSLEELDKQKENTSFDTDGHCSKVCKFSKETDVHSVRRDVDNIFNCKNISKVEAVSFFECFGKPIRSSSTSDTTIQSEEILNAFVHPDVISLICNLLKRR